MSSARLQRLAFLLGLAGFAGLLLAGLYRSLVLEHRAPPLSNDYGSYVNELAAREDWEGVIRALRISARLDLNEPRVEQEIIPNLVRLARRREDQASELVAWRNLVQRRPADPGAHLELAWALLSRALPTVDDLEEAERHGRRALELDPGSVPARVSLGRVAFLEGDRESGFARWQEAAELDPEATDGLLRSFGGLDPEAEAFRARLGGAERG
jgi:tetratricopeptide (TPR) repeat protein